MPSKGSTLKLTGGDDESPDYELRRASSESDVNLTKLRVVRRQQSLTGQVYETTSTVYTNTPAVEKPSPRYLKGTPHYRTPPSMCRLSQVSFD